MAQKRFYSTFRFTGELQIPNDEKKLIQETVYDSGWTKRALKIGVKESKTNSQFVNMEGMIPGSTSFELKKPHKDGGDKKIKFPFKDRNTSAVSDSVADFAKIVVDLETDFEKKKDRISLQMKVRNITQKDTITEEDKIKLGEYRKELEEKSDNVHKFVCEVDAVDFLKENIEVLKAHKVRISGNFSRTTSKGKYYTSYQPSMIELVPSETKNELKVSTDIYFDKDSIDETDFKEDKKIYVNGYIKGYDSKTQSEKYYPQQFVIDASKLDMENPKHVGRLDFIRSTFKVKGKNVFHIPVEFNTYNGSQQVEFTIDMLEERHRTQVELGLKTLEDYKPKGGFILGGKVSEFRFAKLLDADYPDGAEDTEINTSEFEDMIATSSAETVSVEEVKSKETDEVKEESTEYDDIDALFE